LLVDFPLALADRLFDRLFEGGWPGSHVGQINKMLPYHIYDADETDKKFGSYTKGKISATTLPTMQ
jgi:hypothetical protein